MIAIRLLFRTLWLLSTRWMLTLTIQREMRRIRRVCSRIPPGEWRRAVRIPQSPGLSGVMLNWSAGMTLWHMAGVSESIRRTVFSLATGRQPEAVNTAACDFPPHDAGSEQLQRLETSVRAYLDAVSGLPGLRRSLRVRHPVFGMLNAHDWHGMFGLHLHIHRVQLEAVVSRLPR